MPVLRASWMAWIFIAVARPRRRQRGNPGQGVEGDASGGLDDRQPDALLASGCDDDEMLGAEGQQLRRLTILNDVGEHLREGSCPLGVARRAERPQVVKDEACRRWDLLIYVETCSVEVGEVVERS